jgi:putative cardiolipin synthase
MHIKNWIADNRIAIVGGRNVGDEYFTASEDTNFADFELLMLGPVVREASAAFDRYWNAAEVYPIALLNEQPPLTLLQVRAALEEARANALGSRYAAALQQDNAVQQLIGGQAQVYWRHDYQLVVDAPDKHRRDDVLDKSSVLRALLPRLERAQRELLIISPYFVSGKEGTALLVGLAQRGVRVKLLTNSLAANDVAAVHGGYSRYRTILLEGGVELWELKPEAGPINSSLLGSSGASLHTKALAVDGEMLFVGSYNLDPRSTALNAELGVLVDSSAMAQRFAEDFIRHTAGTYAWRVTLDNGTLQWHDDSDVKTREPAASVGRRLVAWLARVLRLDPLL